MQILLLSKKEQQKHKEDSCNKINHIEEICQSQRINRAEYLALSHLSALWKEKHDTIKFWKSI